MGNRRDNFDRVVCKIFGHRWDRTDPYSQPCKRCTAKRVLMRDKFEMIGKNPYSWKIIDLLAIKFKK